MDKYLDYGMPKPLSEYKRILSSTGSKKVQREKAHNLKKLFDTYPNF